MKEIVIQVAILQVGPKVIIDCKVTVYFQHILMDSYKIKIYYNVQKGLYIAS